MQHRSPDRLEPSLYRAVAARPAETGARAWLGPPTCALRRARAGGSTSADPSASASWSCRSCSPRSWSRSRCSRRCTTCWASALALAQIVEGLVHGLAVRARCGSANLLLLDLEVDLLAEHRHVPRGLNADADLLAHDRQHGDLDVVADHDRLIGLACQDQHVDASLPTACRLPLKHVGVPTAKHQRAKVRPTYPRPGRPTVAVGDARSVARLPRRWRAGRCDHTSTRSARGCARAGRTRGSRTSSRSPSSRSRRSSASRGCPPPPTTTATPSPPVSTTTTRST